MTFSIGDTRRRRVASASRQSEALGQFMVDGAVDAGLIELISDGLHDRAGDAGGRRTAHGRTPLISLDDVLITSELRKRGQRRSHLRGAAVALQGLAQQIEECPSDVLPRFVDLARELCRAGSAGISVYEPQPDGPGIFRWSSLTGKALPFGGETTPRDFSPCGMCLDKAEPILMDRPGRYYDWLNLPDLPVAEALLVPLFVAGRKPFGTLWLMAHDGKRFDQGDALALSEMATVLNLALSMIADIAGKDAALKQAEAALHQSSKLSALGQLAGGIAHDLNNLLIVLSGNLELIKDRTQDDKLKVMAERGIRPPSVAESSCIRSYLSRDDSLCVWT
jgi:GAF domain